MQPNLGGVVEFFAETIMLTSFGAETFIKGEKQIGASTTRAIRATVQPTSGEDKLLLPEADRLKSVVTIWTTSEVNPSDEFSYRGKTYKVLALAPRQQNGFWRAVAEMIHA